MNIDFDQKKERRPRQSSDTIVVIIPYYNGSKYIERAVKSVMSQTVPANEFIVVNDGSSEEETIFLHKVSQEHNFTVIDKANGGQGSARNLGVKSSSSEYICFLDQDDYYLENHNEVLIENIPANDARFGWVYADLYEADAEGSIVTTSIVRHYGSHPKTSLFDIIRNDMHVLPSASLISRKAFESIGGFDEQFTGYEDDDLFMRLFRAGYSNTFVPLSVTAWCMHTDSTSYSIRMCRSRMRFFKKMVSEFPDDWGKGRFYLKDMLVPRFHGSFVGDTLMAFLKNKRNSIKIYEHRDELIAMLEEYVSIVNENDSISLAYKIRLGILLKVIKTKNSFLIKSFVGSVGIIRGGMTPLRK